MADPWDSGFIFRQVSSSCGNQDIFMTTSYSAFIREFVYANFDLILWTVPGGLVEPDGINELYDPDSVKNAFTLFCNSDLFKELELTPEEVTCAKEWGVHFYPKDPKALTGRVLRSAGLHFPTSPDLTPEVVAKRRRFLWMMDVLHMQDNKCGGIELMSNPPMVTSLFPNGGVTLAMFKKFKMQTHLLLEELVRSKML